jgi:hypothetical protein
MTPVRGEVWLFDLGMVEKVRPALVISVAFRRHLPGFGDYRSSHDWPSRVRIRDSGQRPILESGSVHGARRFNLPARESDTETRRPRAGSV